MFEVEQKFRVDRFEPIVIMVEELGGTFHPTVTQIDLYFAHPSRDFSVSDEAFRIRRVGQSNFLTYKGPKIDSNTKTRREIELPLPAGEHVSSQFIGLLTSLGFTPVSEVQKQRRQAFVNWCDLSIEVAFDEVTNLGQFVELELLADEQSLDSARQALASLAEKLRLEDNERRSYLELLVG